MVGVIADDSNPDPTFRGNRGHRSGLTESKIDSGRGRRSRNVRDTGCERGYGLA